MCSSCGFVCDNKKSLAMWWCCSRRLNFHLWCVLLFSFPLFSSHSQLTTHAHHHHHHNHRHWFIKLVFVFIFPLSSSIPSSSFLLYFIFNSLHVYTKPLCLRLTMKFLFTHIYLYTQKKALWMFLYRRAFDSTHENYDDTQHQLLFWRVGEWRKKAQNFCVYMLPLLNSQCWCEFMWRWITNQILKAGVKKSHTYDEQNEKVSQGVEFITKNFTGKMIIRNFSSFASSQ